MSQFYSLDKSVNAEDLMTSVEGLALKGWRYIVKTYNGRTYNDWTYNSWTYRVYDSRINHIKGYCIQNSETSLKRGITKSPLEGQYFFE